MVSIEFLYVQIIVFLAALPVPAAAGTGRAAKNE